MIKGAVLLIFFGRPKGWISLMVNRTIIKDSFNMYAKLAWWFLDAISIVFFVFR